MNGNPESQQEVKIVTAHIAGTKDSYRGSMIWKLSILNLQWIGIMIKTNIILHKYWQAINQKGSGNAKNVGIGMRNLYITKYDLLSVLTARIRTDWLASLPLICSTKHRSHKYDYVAPEKRVPQNRAPLHLFDFCGYLSLIHA